MPGAGVLPLAITYDLLGHGRPTAFVRVGARFSLPPGLSRRDSETLVRRREEYGFSYWVVHDGDIDAFAPVVERLAGT